MFVSAAASIIVSPSGTKAVQANSILDLNLNVPITDRNPSFDELEIILDLNDEVLGLPEILSAIDKAAQNPKIPLKQRVSLFILMQIYTPKRVIICLQLLIPSSSIQ